MCNAGDHEMGRVVAYIGHVGPDEDDPEDLACEECGEEVSPDEAMLCLCGKGLCTACVVIGERVDSCKGCADQLALEAAEEEAKHPHLELLQGGVA